MKKIITALTALCLMAGAALSLVGCSDKNVSTETDGKTVALPDKTVSAPDGDSYSIITKLDLNVKFDNNIAKATVKNSFTLFPAKAQVYVYLYFAEIYTTDYTKMQEVANNYIKDLDMNKTLTATYEMQGESGYFRVTGKNARPTLIKETITEYLCRPSRTTVLCLYSKTLNPFCR